MASCMAGKGCSERAHRLQCKQARAPCQTQMYIRAAKHRGPFTPRGVTWAYCVLQPSGGKHAVSEATSPGGQTQRPFLCVSSIRRPPQHLFCGGSRLTTARASHPGNNSNRCPYRRILQGDQGRYFTHCRISALNSFLPVWRSIFIVRH
jgi:hypothetical protein